jgi:cell division protein FtsB
VHVNLGIWDKLNRVAIFLLFVAGLLGVTVWYLPLIKQNERMRQQLFQTDLKVKQEEERAKSLRAAVEAAKNDPRTIERTARANLGYAKPGEVVIRFETPATGQ